MGHEHRHDLLSLTLGQRPLVSQLTLHVVSPEISTTKVTLLIQHMALALPPIIRPVAVIDLLQRCVIHPATAVTLSVQVLSIVNVAAHTIVHTAALRLTIVLPAALIYRPIQVNNLAVAFFNEGTMLAKVDVSRLVQKFANRVTVTFNEHSFVNDSGREEQTAHPVQLIIFERPNIDVSILESHFTAQALVVLPNAGEGAAVHPCNSALSVALASFPDAFILRLFELATVLPRQTIVVLHGAVTTRPAVLERTSELVPVLKINHTKAKRDVKNEILTYL